jgi:hypothetical protein
VTSTVSGVRRRVVFGLSLGLNFVLPWALYRLSEPHVGETHALIVSAAVPMAWSVVQLARNRKLDAVSVLALLGIALSFVALALGGSPKVLLFRQSLLTGAVGLVLIGSAVIRRPLFYALVVAALGPQAEPGADTPSNVWSRARAELESYADKPSFRRSMTTLTVFSGLLLILEAAVRITIAFELPTERALLVGPAVTHAMGGLFILLVLLYVFAMKSRWEDDA